MNKETIARERYTDLCNYFDNDKDVIETLVNNREEFLKWLERMRWHVKKSDELFRENEAYQKAFEDIKAEIEEQILDSLSDGGDDWFTAEKVNECLEIIDKHNPDNSRKEKE